MTDVMTALIHTLARIIHTYISLITRDADVTVWCDQSKKILHCLNEMHSGSVSLRRAHTLPSVDEQPGDEDCRKYLGQMMWLTTKTRPDTSACLGIMASRMVRRSRQDKAHLMDLWRYLWTTVSYAMCTLLSPKASEKNLSEGECLRELGRCAPKSPKDSCF